MKLPLLTAAALTLTTTLSLAADPPKYNLITIITDDQAAWSIGAYGNKDSQTKNQDRLAREGALFENAFTTTPVCSPSRAGFFTGLYPTQVGITDWINPAEARVAGLGIPNVPTWPAVLQKNGYVTGLFGKWHLGLKPGFHPTRHGFTEFQGFLGGGAKSVDPTFDLDTGPAVVKGFTADLVTDRTIDFVRRHKDQPFAAVLAFREPHVPYYPVSDADSAPFKDLDPTIPDVKGNDAEQVKEWTRRYYAAIHSVDRNLGRLLDELDKQNLSDRTIILFTSDHGYNIGHHNIYTKGNGHWIAGGVGGPKRPNMFDTSIRVPLLVRWPGVVKPGTRIAQPVTLLDTFPTALAMANVPIPPDAKQNGADYTPLLKGDTTVKWRDAVFGQYDLHNAGIDFMRMIRTDKYKLVRHHFSNGLNELYDLEKDPGETRNLWSTANLRKTRDDLDARLDAWEQSINDPIRTDPHRKTEAEGPSTEE